MRTTWISMAVAAAMIAGAPAYGTETYANAELLVTAEELAEGTEVLFENGDTRNDEAGIILVDVRPLEAYRQGHIPGARHLDPNAVADPNAPIDGTLRSETAVARILADLGISAASQIVFYDDKGGFHASRMFWVAEYLGHRKVALLDGGLQAWTEQGGRLAREDSAIVAPGTFSPAVVSRRHATADYILAHADDPETVVIDVRPSALYSKGHIPWAKNIPWKGNLTEDLRMKPASALAAHFAAQGITPDKSVVIHCQNGLASAHSYFALRLLGHPRVRVYHRSWSEWGADDALPRASGV